jgi:hypothetical protein
MISGISMYRIRGEYSIIRKTVICHLKRFARIRIHHIPEGRKETGRFFDIIKELFRISVRMVDG